MICDDVLEKGHTKDVRGCCGGDRSVKMWAQRSDFPVVWPT